MLSDPSLKDFVCFLFQDAEARQIRGRPVLVIKCSQVKAFVMSKSVVGYDLQVWSDLKAKIRSRTHFRSQEQMLLFSFSFFGFDL